MCTWQPVWCCRFQLNPYTVSFASHMFQKVMVPACRCLARCERCCKHTLNMFTDNTESPKVPHPVWPTCKGREDDACKNHLLNICRKYIVRSRETYKMQHILLTLLRTFEHWRPNVPWRSRKGCCDVLHTQRTSCLHCWRNFTSIRSMTDLKGSSEVNAFALAIKFLQQFDTCCK